MKFFFILLLSGMIIIPAEAQKRKTVTSTLRHTTYHGNTEPFKQATISAPFASVITRIAKKEGATVYKGDTILKLDFVEAQLDAERSRILSESTAELRAAKYKAETAARDYHATKLLHDSTRAISDEELWKKELDYNLSKAEHERLKTVKSKELLEYRIALDHLSHFFIIAPFSGIIAQSYLYKSEACKPQEPLVHLVDINKCRFTTYIPAVHARELEKGKEVTISLEGASNPLSRSGIIEFISPVVDPSSGLRTVKIVFDNKDKSIQPGVKGSLILKP